eukprot:TRINITY_DN9859_c0_g1_i1.p1 TRINITY_DN9859_c0_g1~~TRINITY_DN9859_c0_g1_i1.p1  ORF type:complete len:371 (+),score=129.71 TRINITY_DN9859_c0_g1_i1:745-1857(+)
MSTPTANNTEATPASVPDATATPTPTATATATASTPTATATPTSTPIDNGGEETAATEPRKLEKAKKKAESLAIKKAKKEAKLSSAISYAQSIPVYQPPSHTGPVTLDNIMQRLLNIESKVDLPVVAQLEEEHRNARKKVAKAQKKRAKLDESDSSSSSSSSSSSTSGKDKKKKGKKDKKKKDKKKDKKDKSDSSSEEDSEDSEKDLRSKNKDQKEKEAKEEEADVSPVTFMICVDGDVDAKAAMNTLMKSLLNVKRRDHIILFTVGVEGKNDPADILALYSRKLLAEEKLLKLNTGKGVSFAVASHSNGKTAKKDIGAAILKASEEKKVDFIVLGSRKEKKLGSVGSYILAQATVPVVFVRHPEEEVTA